MDDLTIPLVAGAGTLAAAYILGGRSRNEAPPLDLDDLVPRHDNKLLATTPARWVWPVGIWHGRRPLISSGYGTPRGTQLHEGVDVMFRRLPTDNFPVGSPNGSKNYVFPDGVWGLAAADGFVWSAGWTPRGFTVVIDHGSVATYYTHMDSLLLLPTARGRSGERVKAGQPMGVVGYDPKDGRKLKHLHFAYWRGGPRDAIDPEPIMKSWQMVIDPGESTAPPAGGAIPPVQL